MKEGWEYKKLGEVAEVIHGKNQKDVLSEEGQYPIYGSGGNIMGYANNYLCEAGTTILGRKGSINNPQFIEERFWNVDTAFGISAKEGYNSKFIYYFVTSINWLKKNTGTTLPSLTQQVVKSVELPIPSFSEQQSIVDYLDSAFAKIDAMKANAEKALNEAKALFQASLKEMLEPKEGWEEKTLKDVSVIYGNYGLSVPSTEYNGVRYLRITDITEWGDLNDEKVSAKLDEEKEQELLEEGDILFARTGATVGKTLMYKEAFGKCLFAGYLIRYRINKEIVLPKFIFYITHSANYYKWVLENQKAAAQPNISAKLYNEYVLSFPSLSEQQTIVNTLDSLKSKVDQLQENYNKISQECDALKQAILRQVFE